MTWWRRTRPESSTRAAESGMALIRLNDVTKTFKTEDADEETRALSNVSIDIHRGEYVSVSGPSGCGKSTLLAILALLESPTNGAIFSTGEPSINCRRQTKRGCAACGANAAERKDRVEAALDRVGMMAQAKQRPGQLSGGHQQLVAIARAIAGRPPILLADEPTGNLDSRNGDALMQMLTELHGDGATVCMATHDPRYVAQAQRHIYLFDGRVVSAPAA